MRKEIDLPEATEEWGWKYHHMGIPTEIEMDGERHLPGLGMHVSGFETSPFGVEWMRFDPDSPVDPLIRRVPHIAFVVDDLEKALEGRELIGDPSAPMDGLRVAMIRHNNMPVELMEFDGPGAREE